MNKLTKYTIDQKLQACRDFKSGKSSREVAKSLGMTKNGYRSVREWVRKYELYGDDAFSTVKKNVYTKEFKTAVAKEYVDGKASYRGLMFKYHLSDTRLVRDWVRIYREEQGLTESGKEIEK